MVSIEEKKKTEPLCRIRDIYRMVNDFESMFQKNFEVGLNEGMLLCSLAVFGQSTSGQIAELLGLKLSNASKVILSAERKGLVKRIIGKDDKRNMFFCLTPQGEERIDTIKCNSNDFIRLISKIKEI